MREWVKPGREPAKVVAEIAQYLEKGGKQLRSNLRLTGAAIVHDAIESGLRENVEQVFVEAWARLDAKTQQTMAAKLLNGVTSDEATKKLAHAQLRCQQADKPDLLPNLVSAIADGR